MNRGTGTFKTGIKKNFIRSILYFIACMMIFLSVMYIVESKEVNTKRFILSENEKNIVTIQKNIIETSMDVILVDMKYIENSWVMQDYLSDSSNRQVLERQLISFAMEKKIYDQIRFIDNEGREAVRINYNGGKPSAVPDYELQDKSDRYYFKNAIDIDEDQIYTSPLDLNVENGEIETPVKPMIRVAVPTYDSKGQKRGIVLLNYMANGIIDRYENTVLKSSGRSFWLDENGYWIVSDEKEKQWAFMYEGMNDVSFSNEFSEEWEIVSEQEKGQFYTEKGFFTFDTIHIESDAKHEIGTSRIHDRHWKMVSYVPRGAMPFVEENQFEAIMVQIGNKKAALFALVMAALTIAVLDMKNRIAREDIRINATYDGLTGVYNRGSGMKLLTEKIRESKTREEFLSICFIDINGLKSVNDILGHEKGDELIRSCADVFSRSIRSNDFVARWGGDEFLIVFPSSTAKTAEKVWDRIYNEIESINATEERDYIISASHGIEEFNKRDSYEIDVLVKAADEKMYEEKAEIKRNLEVIRRMPSDSTDTQELKKMA